MYGVQQAYGIMVYGIMFVVCVQILGWFSVVIHIENI